MNAENKTLALATYFGAGLLFAAGLVLAGMTQPAKVVGFLDVTGDWDPSLAFVMVGGILTHMALYKLILKRSSPVFEARFGIPTRRDLTPRLIGGSALFGIGWAIAGYCPGPGLVAAGSFSGQGLVFIVSMLAGMGLFHWVDRYRQESRTKDEAAAAPAGPALQVKADLAATAAAEEATRMAAR